MGVKFMDINIDKELKELAERIKKRREELNLSYEDLEKRTGIKKSTLKKYETRADNITLNKFKTLSEGLEIEPDKLMGWC